MYDPDEIVNYHQGCRLRSALCQSIEPYGQVAQPGTRTHAANTNVSTSPLTELIGHRDSWIRLSDKPHIQRTLYAKQFC